MSFASIEIVLYFRIYNINFVFNFFFLRTFVCALVVCKIYLFAADKTWAVFKKQLNATSDRDRLLKHLQLPNHIAKEWGPACVRRPSFYYCIWFRFSSTVYMLVCRCMYALLYAATQRVWYRIVYAVWLMPAIAFRCLILQTPAATAVHHCHCFCCLKCCQYCCCCCWICYFCCCFIQYQKSMRLNKW